MEMGILIACLTAACASNDTERVTEHEVIGFRPGLTRGAVISLGEGDSFAVWARESDSGTARMILTQEEVHCTGGLWDYDNLRYWKASVVYDFYALYPHDVVSAELQNNATGETPRISVTDFDARYSRDLMTAEQTDFLYTGNPTPVTFTFRHLLSKVELVGRIDPALDAVGVSARIVSAALYGMPATGSCTVDAGTYGTWSFGSPTTSAGPFSSSTENTLTVTGISLFGELFPFPQTVTDDFVLEIVYEYTDPDYSQNRFSKTIRLVDAGVTEWKPGTGYRYTFTVGSDYILFETPEVIPWRSASGGIVTVE